MTQLSGLHSNGPRMKIVLMYDTILLSYWVIVVLRALPKVDRFLFDLCVNASVCVCVCVMLWLAAVSFSCHCPQSHDSQGGFHTCHEGESPS